MDFAKAGIASFQYLIRFPDAFKKNLCDPKQKNIEALICPPVPILNIENSRKALRMKSANNNASV